MQISNKHCKEKQYLLWKSPEISDLNNVIYGVFLLLSNIKTSPMCHLPYANVNVLTL